MNTNVIVTAVVALAIVVFIRSGSAVDETVLNAA